MNSYSILLQHDYGYFSMVVVANSMSEACDQATDRELAPFRAIKKVALLQSKNKY